MSLERRAAGELDGVLFDIDDTLVDTAGAFLGALRAACARFLPGTDDAGLGALVAHWRADDDGHYARYTRGEIDYHGQRLARVNLLHAHAGGQRLDGAGYAEWSALFDEGFAAAWAVLDDVERTLDALDRAGVRVASLSNASTEMQTRKLTKVGLVDRVPLLVSIDTLGFGKPDPRVFLAACERLGTEPARTVYVGDELDVDALGAVRAGLRGVWVDRPGARRHVITDDAITQARAAGVVVVTDLGDLPAVLGL